MKFNRLDSINVRSPCCDQRLEFTDLQYPNHSVTYSPISSIGEDQEDSVTIVSSDPVDNATYSLELEELLQKLALMDHVTLVHSTVKLLEKESTDEKELTLPKKRPMPLAEPFVNHINRPFKSLDHFVPVLEPIAEYSDETSLDSDVGSLDLEEMSQKSDLIPIFHQESNPSTIASLDCSCDIIPCKVDEPRAEIADYEMSECLFSEQKVRYLNFLLEQ